jgi:hypothetical protein
MPGFALSREGERPSCPGSRFGTKGTSSRRVSHSCKPRRAFAKEKKAFVGRRFVHSSNAEATIVFVVLVVFAVMVAVVARGGGFVKY